MLNDFFRDDIPQRVCRVKVERCANVFIGSGDSFRGWKVEPVATEHTVDVVHCRFLRERERGQSQHAILLCRLMTDKPTTTYGAPRTTRGELRGDKKR